MSPPVRDLVSSWRGRLPAGVSHQQLVFAAATVMILLQLVLRAWAIYGGWFYGDDFGLLSRAQSEALSLDYVAPGNGEPLMPGGVLLSWVVGQGPAYSWALAATTILALQASASLACLLMLTRLFGVRTGILAPLGLYLFAPVTLGAFMWWTSALQELPVQITFFAALTTHVTYLRTRRLRWAGASVALVVVGMLFHLTSILVAPVAALLTLAYFTDGGRHGRIVTTVRRFWPVWLGYLVVSITYLVVYARTAGLAVDDRSHRGYLPTFDRQVRETFGPAVVGGPWRWLGGGLPDVLAHAPQVAITLAWIAITAVVALTSWWRRGAWRGWAILAIHLAATVALTARGLLIVSGADAGFYLRHLSTVAVVGCLALALSTTEPVGRPEARGRGFNPPIPLRPIALVLSGLVLAGSVISTLTYARHWHRDSPAELYVAAAASDLRPLQGLDIVDEPVARTLGVAPGTRPSGLLAPLHKDLRPVSAGTDLRMFGTDGRLGRAVVTPGVSARVRKNADCGLLIHGSTTAVVRLNTPVSDDAWWMEIGYLGSGDGQVRIEAGSTTRVLPVRQGLHTLLFRTTGSYDSVSVESTTSSLGVCVDDITVGSIGTFS